MQGNDIQIRIKAVNRLYVSYLPMQNVKVIDNKNFTDLRLK